MCELERVVELIVVTIYILILPHGVRKAPMHSAGSSPRHRARDLQNPPDTYVGARNRKMEEC